MNLRTLIDRAGTDRPERRSALIARELERYKVQIAALSETRLANEGQLSEAHGRAKAETPASQNKSEYCFSVCFYFSISLPKVYKAFQFENRPDQPSSHPQNPGIEKDRSCGHLRLRRTNIIITF